jgi:Family of unknown function (DUF5706)
MNSATLQYIENMIAATREELVRAESKAALLVAASGVGISALVASLVGSRWTPFRLHNAVEWLWWAGLASASGGVVLLGNAVYPRLERSRSAIVYFRDVVLTPRSELTAKLEDSAQLGGEQLVEQLLQLSRIVNRKYLSIRSSLWCLTSGLLLFGTALLLDMPMH